MKVLGTCLILILSGAAAAQINGQGTITGQGTIKTSAVTPGGNNPTATLTANPLSITAGQSSTLTWTSTNATGVTLNSTTVALSGTQSVSPSVSTTYTLIATGAAGTTPYTVAVTVSIGVPPPAGVPWAGIIDTSRAIDFSKAGVQGGIPTITTICKTVPPSGIDRWLPSHAYAAGNQISDNNGNLQQVTAGSGSSSATVPTWTTTLNGTTTDGPLTWTLQKTIPTATGGLYNGNDFQNLKQAALDCLAGGVIQLTAGQYYFTNAVQLWGNSNTVLRGAGPLQTNLRFYQGGSYIQIITPSGYPWTQVPNWYTCGAAWTGTNNQTGIYSQGATVLNIGTISGNGPGGPFSTCAFNSSVTPQLVSNSYGSGQVIYGSVINLEQRGDEIGICPPSGGTNNCQGVIGATASGTTATIVTTIPHGLHVGEKVAVGEVAVPVTGWTANTAYSVGQAITDSILNNNGDLVGNMVQVVITAGTSGTTEPNWTRSTLPNSPTTDNTVVWTMGGCSLSGSSPTGTGGYNGAGYATNCFNSTASNINASLLLPNPPYPPGCGGMGAYMPPQGQTGAYFWNGNQIGCQWWTVTDVGCIVAGAYVTSTNCNPATNPIIAFQYQLPAALPPEVNPAVGGLPSGGGYITGETEGIISSGIGGFTFSGGPVSYLGSGANGRLCKNSRNNNTSGLGDIQCLPGETSRWNMMEIHRVVDICTGGTWQNAGTACSANTIQIDPPIMNTSFRSSQNPSIYWLPKVVRDGVEDLTVDGLYDNGTNGGKIAVSQASRGGANINISHCYQCWVRNVRSIWGGRDHVQFQHTMQGEVRDSYAFASTGAQSTSYGLESLGNNTLLLMINNIMQGVVSPTLWQGDTGNVEAYNYMIDPQYSPPTFGMQLQGGNHAFSNVGLHESTVTNAMNLDNNHGEGWQSTYFRNRERQIQFPARGYDMSPINVMGFNRGHNFVGNVLGWPGVNIYYEQNGRPVRGATQVNASVMPVFALGDPNLYPPDDPLVKGSLLRWGNYDVATGSTRWCGTGNEGGVTCSCGPAITNFQVDCKLESEIPTVGIPGGVNANAIPANHTLPASFFLTGVPQFWTTAWGTPGWPAIGPDVNATGSPLDATCAISPLDPSFADPTNPYPCDGVNHMSYLIPSQICFINTPIDTNYQLSIPITGATFQASGAIAGSTPALNAQYGGAVILTLPSIDPTPGQGIYNRTGLSVPIAVKVSGVNPPQYNGIFVLQQVCKHGANFAGYMQIGNVPACAESPPTVTYFLQTGATAPSGNGTGGTVTGQIVRAFDAKACYPNEPLP